MNAATLLATDNVHYQIEELFKRHKLFYDRRPGFYRDQGFAAASIISVTELVQAIITLIEYRPDTARARPSEYINKDTQYKKLFAQNRVPLIAYYKAMTVVRAVEDYMRTRRLDKGVQSNYKYYVAYEVSVHLSGKLHFSPDDLLAIEQNRLTDAVIEESFLRVNRRYGDLLLGDTPDDVAKGPGLLAALKHDLGERFDPSPLVAKRSRKLKPRDVVRELEGL